jgi:hypothetical protein
VLTYRQGTQEEQADPLCATDLRIPALSNGNDIVQSTLDRHSRRVTSSGSAIPRQSIEIEYEFAPCSSFSGVKPTTVIAAGEVPHWPCLGEIDS